MVNIKNFCLSIICKVRNKKMIYILSIAFWPLINYITSNIDKINDYTDIYFIALSLFALSVLSWFVIKKVIKNKIERFLLPLAITTILFFGYSSIVETIGQAIPSIYIKSTYIWLILSVIITYFSWKLSTSSNGQKITKTIILAIFILSVSNLLWAYWQHKKTDNSVNIINQENISFKFKHHPNIYYILVDAYARQDTLKEVADFDNEPFLQELEKRGFAVSREAYSNYHFTIASLSATMNMALHSIISTSKGIVCSQDQMYESLSGNNKVRKILINNGYKIINIPAYFHETKSYKLEDASFRGYDYEILISFFSSTPLRTFVLRKACYVNISDIKKTLSIFEGYPKFIFVHLAHVHDAVYDKEGKISDQGELIFKTGQDNKKYIFSIQAINKELIQLIDYIKQHDKNSIIIIQSDHGPTFVGNQKFNDWNYFYKNVHEEYRIQNFSDYRYSFGIISAIYLPKYNEENFNNANKYFSGKFTLINVFRYLFSYLSEKSPHIAEDKSTFLIYNRVYPYYVVDQKFFITIKGD